MKLDEAIEIFCDEIHTVIMAADHADVPRYNSALNTRNPLAFEAAPGIEIHADVYGVKHFDNQGVVEYSIQYRVADDGERTIF